MKKCEEFAPLLSAFVDGELTEEERAEVLAHVSECEKCRRLLGELTALEGFRMSGVVPEGQLHIGAYFVTAAENEPVPITACRKKP